MNEWMNEQMNEWMNKWMNEWMNEWMNKWMNECKYSSNSTDITVKNDIIHIYFPASALLNLFDIHDTQPDSSPTNMTNLNRMWHSYISLHCYSLDMLNIRDHKTTFSWLKCIILPTRWWDLLSRGNCEWIISLTVFAVSSIRNKIIGDRSERLHYLWISNAILSLAFYAEPHEKSRTFLRYLAFQTYSVYTSRPTESCQSSLHYVLDVKYLKNLNTYNFRFLVHSKYQYLLCMLQSVKESIVTVQNAIAFE